MAFRFADTVKEIVTTPPGTGALLLAGAVTGGFIAFSAIPSIANADMVPYSIWDGAGGREDGYATYNSGPNSLTRTTVTSSTNGGAAVNFTTGVTVWCAAHAAALMLRDSVGNLLVAASTNAVVSNTLRNSSAGTLAQVILSLSNGTNEFEIHKYGTGFTTSGLQIQNGTLLQANGAGGLAINSQSNSMLFGIGGATAALIDTSGRFGVGTTPSSGQIAHFQSNTNGQTSVVVSNTSAGAAAYAEFLASNGTTLAGFKLLGPGYSGTWAAGSAVIDCSAGLILQSGASTGIIFGVNGSPATVANLSAAGNFGLGMTPIPISNYKVLDVGTTTGSGGGTGGIIALYAGASGYRGGIYADAATAGFRIQAVSSDPIIFETGGNEKIRLDTSGNLLIGATAALSGSQLYIKMPAITGLPLLITDSAGSNVFLVQPSNAISTGYSGTGTVIYLGKDNATSRSINAAGSINASGADYAEYERKARGVFAAGDVVGFNSDGHLTDQWAEAISFGVKSTNPCMVGGDTWGSKEVLGVDRPADPGKAPVKAKDVKQEDYDKTLRDHTAAVAKYAQDKSAFETVLEAARAQVDRIAYSGKVPVNIQGAHPGDMILASQDGTGIKPIAVAKPKFDEMPRALGRVRRILPDGRAEIAVIVS